MGRAGLQPHTPAPQVWDPLAATPLRNPTPAPQWMLPLSPSTQGLWYWCAADARASSEPLAACGKREKFLLEAAGFLLLSQVPHQPGGGEWLAGRGWAGLGEAAGYHRLPASDQTRLLRSELPRSSTLSPLVWSSMRFRAWGERPGEVAMCSRLHQFWEAAHTVGVSLACPSRDPPEISSSDHDHWEQGRAAVWGCSLRALSEHLALAVCCLV